MRSNEVKEIEEDVKVVVKKKEVKKEEPTAKVAGRPTVGKSKATNKIAFVVDDEQLEFLESLTDRKDRTPNAVAKKIFLAHYELQKDK